MNDDNEPLCDKLLLLLLDRDGKLVSGSATGYLLGGALLADLALRGRVDIARKGDPVKPGRVLVRSPVPTGDSLLDDALGRVQRRQGDRPSSVIGPLSKGTRRAVLERLIAAGTIGEASRNALGLFPVRSLVNTPRCGHCWKGACCWDSAGAGVTAWFGRRLTAFMTPPPPVLPGL
jgi:hypothetical protein